LVRARLLRSCHRRIPQSVGEGLLVSLPNRQVFGPLFFEGSYACADRAVLPGQTAKRHHHRNNDRGPKRDEILVAQNGKIRLNGVGIVLPRSRSSIGAPTAAQGPFATRCSISRLRSVRTAAASADGF
jgi:hypothetical protein